jgi:hypothetical protein
MLMIAEVIVLETMLMIPEVIVFSAVRSFHRRMETIS